MGRENNLEILFTPTFIKFVEHYTAKFIAYEKSGHKYSRWLHEYEDLYQRGMFKPTIIRDQYIKMLKNEFRLGYIRGTVFWHIGINAHDATKAYFDNVDCYRYKICVFTGEIAIDDDGDEYVDLAHDEADQICKALNDEAEEQLFIVKRM